MVSYILIGIVSVGGLIGALLLGRRKNAKTWGVHNDEYEIDVQGKVVLITGSSSGIGKQVALELAKRGATLILPCRDEATGLATVTQIKRDLKLKDGGHGVGEGSLIPMVMDLSSLISIRSFVRDLKEEHPQLHIDILINNAGVYVPYSMNNLTKDGFEINFGINYLAHFLLTNLLLQENPNNKPSRIVNVASSLHESGDLKLGDLNLRNLSPQEEKMVKPYSNSKLAQIYFSYELGNRLAGTGVHTYALCPGWVKTGLNRNAGLKWYQYVGMLPFAILFMRSVEQGSQTVLHCALSREAGLETGKLYKNCEIWNSKKLPVSDAKSKQLWEESCRLVGLKV